MDSSSKTVVIKLGGAALPHRDALLADLRAARAEAERLRAELKEFMQATEYHGDRHYSYRTRALALLRQVRAARSLLRHSLAMQEHYAELAANGGRAALRADPATERAASDR